jgi:hypothetical protein
VSSKSTARECYASSGLSGRQLVNVEPAAGLRLDGDRAVKNGSKIRSSVAASIPSP